MATSSRFIQLSSSVLMEYIYADQSEINQPSNPYRISTTQSPIRKTKNDYNNQAQILNSDAAEQVFENLPKGTGNVRNRSFAIIEPYRAALLDIDKTIYYNDYDPKLTPSSQLPIIFDTPKAPVYDTIKLHLVQGFNFENTDGLTLTFKISDKTDKKIVICNLVYNKSDLWETMNPAPFFFGGKVYNSYLEVRILSTYNLIYDYWLGVLTGDTVVERITNQVGIKKEQLISAYFSFVSAKTCLFAVHCSQYLTSAVLLVITRL